MSVAAVDNKTQYLSFMLDEGVFSIDIGKVKEVLDLTEITKVPQTPTYMRGIINLRGGVVPVVDLKLKFGLGRTESTVNTCIIISEVNIAGEIAVLGMLSDSVREVFDLSDEDIVQAPRIGTHLNTEFLSGMGKKDNEFIMILDIDKVFTSSELEAVARVTDGSLKTTLSL